MVLYLQGSSQGPNIGATSSHGNAERRRCMSQGASSSCNLRRACSFCNVGFFIQVFEMLKEQQPFYQPNAGTYMKLIVLLGRSGQPQHVRNLFSMMIEEGPEPTAELYTTLLAHFTFYTSNLMMSTTGLVGSAYQHCEDDSHSFINAFGNVADTASAGTEHYYTKILCEPTLALLSASLTKLSFFLYFIVFILLLESKFQVALAFRLFKVLKIYQCLGRYQVLEKKANKIATMNMGPFQSCWKEQYLQFKCCICLHTLLTRRIINPISTNVVNEYHLMEKLFSDIKVPRTDLVAIFLKIEVASWYPPIFCKYIFYICYISYLM
ncbi:Pentatricopeptide repeat-containing protein [Artemisia annua]|uniref:Pentatricopeptide repeat-containing protein n=1 Tax=Artemisia annua TaxID=35608 RepID=A0A2U1L8N9_ARTAN|nr:Pentatricopeptide repeat-containing protein [Artemisia annua]